MKAPDISGALFLYSYSLKFFLKGLTNVNTADIIVSKICGTFVGK